jgi:nucleotide-binding universal stress UspA family protein
MRNEIVVGLDDSPSSKAALDWAAQQAKSTGAALRAVHALDWPYGLSSAGFPSPLNPMEVSGEELQASYKQAITDVFNAVSPQPEWILQFATGDAGQVLVDQSQDARLLVVGTREHVGLGRLLTTSVSHYCLSRAACPVVAVPAPSPNRPSEDAEAGTEGAGGKRRASRAMLVVGVDASAESLAAARYAIAAAEMRDSDVILVHAFPDSSGKQCPAAGELAMRGGGTR